MIIKIIVPTQQLILVKDDEILDQFSISTAKKGVGELKGSEMTPRGWHQIKVKIGEGCPINTVFVGRRATGEVYSPELEKEYPKRDWILTRILWLSGLEPGFNRYGSCDSLKRFIYIHGTPDDAALGVAASHGCIRMRNHDVMKLFDQVNTGTRVLITEEDHAINNA